MSSKSVKCDLLVIGSGAAGMAAALKAASEGHSVIVAEKSQWLGGTTAISGGWAWVPGNKQGVAQGDTRQEIETYIRALAKDCYKAEMVDTFLDEVPEAIDWLERDTDVEFVYPEMAPDYQMDAPGAKPSGRAISGKVVDARTLGENRLRLRPYLDTYTVFGYMPEVGPDIAQFLHANQSLKSFAYVSKKLLKTWVETVLCRRSFDRTNGNSLMVRMVSSAAKLGIRMWTETPVTKILQSESGVVTGAVLGGVHAGTVEARLGVVIAAGGYSSDAALRAEYWGHDPHGDNHFTPTVGHDGDNVRLAAPLGGHVDTDVHEPAAWAPVTVFTGLRGQQRIFPHLRAFGLPGLIAVNRKGERFANESSSYHDFGMAMIQENAGQDATFGYIIADSKAMNKYGIGYAKPWPIPQGYFKKTGFLHKADTVEELARKIGVDAAGLKKTLSEFNSGAAKGEDPKFNRGSNWFHHFKGDMEHQPNPNLEPLDKGPYYAAKIEMGDLGAYSGLAVDRHSQVLDDDNQPIPGLFAAGSAAVSIFGGGYPGYGANIGPALVFGYTIGRDAARLAELRDHPALATIQGEV
ncbi:FAD-dependent oxidoreductase [Rhodococcus pseudokoreensis]|uniref:FAD-dependent oxidoreductase n=1 Tax=Rhodococcus pseudokoreensis TaxID=2811421 RepID=A0A974W7M6_9NOCA|nr:FAD-dependent oxidoreductase [Rhodococcus pseudokoreensis]QSE92773.1 FAD-dependent oxidoreductase [Rhodococcus pseudokoreensis]